MRLRQQNSPSTKQKQQRDQKQKSGKTVGPASTPQSSGPLGTVSLSRRTAARSPTRRRLARNVVTITVEQRTLGKNMTKTRGKDVTPQTGRRPTKRRNRSGVMKNIIAEFVKILNTQINILNGQEVTTSGSATTR